MPLWQNYVSAPFLFSDSLFFLGVAREWIFHSINNLTPFQACGLTDSPGSFLSSICTRSFGKMTVLIFTWWIRLVPEVLIPGLKISTLWFVTSWLRIYLTMKGRVQFFFWASVTFYFPLDVTIYRETITDRVIILITQQGPLWSSFFPKSKLNMNALQ